MAKDGVAAARRRAHPKDAANILSLITFFYTFGLFRDGYRKDIEEQDLYSVLTKCHSGRLGDELEGAWELDRKVHERPRLLRVLWTCFGRTYLAFGLIQLIMRITIILTIPNAMGKLISYFTEGQTNLTKTDACYYASILIIFTIINFVYMQNYLIQITELGIRVRTALCSLIYRKALKLSCDSLNSIGVGRIVTLITKDVTAFEMMIFYGNDVWIGLVQTGVVCYLIYTKIGIAAFVGIGFFLITLPTQILIGKFASSFRLETSRKTDERLQTTQETLSFIKIIKMYTWEPFFRDRITGARKEEIRSIHRIFYMKIVIIIIGLLSSKIAFFLLIMTNVWMGNAVTAEIIYFIGTCFHKMRHFLNFIVPLGISHAAELHATLTRIGHVLEAEELPAGGNALPTRVPRIVFKEVAAVPAAALRGISFTIEPGLTVVAGPTGCGKTLLLKAILREVPVAGELSIEGRVSYAPQEPWLFPSSIRNNILFGERLDEARYRRVLRACALEDDLRAIPDETIVGDCGLNLSKGQQARISLARAVYRPGDVYLLDDCLSSLNGAVSDAIFKDCFAEFLQGKIVLFVTNNQEHINQANNIIQIDENSVKLLNKSDIKANSVLSAPVEAGEGAGEQEESANIYLEVKQSGKVDFEVYRRYGRFGGGVCMVIGILLLYSVYQSAVAYTEKLISGWVTLEQNISKALLADPPLYERLLNERKSTLTFYAGMTTLTTVLLVIQTFIFFGFARRASINLHKLMISKIINSTLAFFDTHFIGNILNRFSKDLYTIDEHLPFAIHDCLHMSLLLIGVIILISTVNALFLIPASIFFVVAYAIRTVYQPTGRSLQRLDASTRSPVIGHLKSSLEGLTTVRAFNAQNLLINEFDNRQDLYTSANFTLHACRRALALVLEAVCTVFITIVITRFLITDNDTTVGNVGLAITQAFSLANHLQHAIKRWSDFENEMTSVERVLEYTKSAQEKLDGKAVGKWPAFGRIVFENVSLKLRNSNILRNLNFTIEEGSKVGIVGRTGAGKSSIVAVLFNMYQFDGRVLIDGANISELSVTALRSQMAIIPQDPIYFTGTVRENIDPLNKHSDSAIWTVLETLQFKRVVESLSDTPKLSAGQKQLICLGRALLRKNRIVILDEATANLDEKTDCLIRKIVDEKFKHCTVITIAHRMSSVINLDKVIVVDRGEIVEYDNVQNLLNNENSLFCKIMKK